MRCKVVLAGWNYLRRLNTRTPEQHWNGPGSTSFRRWMPVGIHARALGGATT